MNKVNFVKVVDSKSATNIHVLADNALTEKHVFMAETCTVKQGGYVVVDFGKEICGRVHVVFGYNECEGKVRIRLGESVAEACAELGQNNAGNNHSLRDAVYPVVCWSDFSTTESGFRFARIDPVGGADVNITAVYAEEDTNGLTMQGKFNCSDERINDIFDVAASTISLCVREKEIWDGVKRDRVVWIGDFYPELVGAFNLYGVIPQFTRVLDMVSDFDGCWVNRIPSYSAWWLVCLAEYYKLSGDKSYVLQKLPYVYKILCDFDEIVQPDGNICYSQSNNGMFDGNEFFVDWPTHQTADSEIGWRYLLTYALQQTKAFLAELGEPTANIEQTLARLDMYDYKQSTFKQVTALGVLANRIDETTATKLLREGGANGMTAFMSCVIVKALQNLGEGEFALKVIRDYFGAMLDMGATTFWEDFDMAWLADTPSPITVLPNSERKNIHADYGKFCYKGLRHSLCHGWSSGFIDFFFGYVLGIVPAAVGYQSVSITPHLCGLDFAEGELPTRYGKIYVRHELSNGVVKSTVRLPDGVILTR